MQNRRGFASTFCLQTAPALEIANDIHPTNHDCDPRS